MIFSDSHFLFAPYPTRLRRTGGSVGSDTKQLLGFDIYYIDRTVKPNISIEQRRRDIYVCRSGKPTRTSMSLLVGISSEGVLQEPPQRTDRVPLDAGYLMPRHFFQTGLVHNLVEDIHHNL